MIVDIGAGTTDFGMFEIMANASTGYQRTKEIRGSKYGVSVAGDKLDQILLMYILKDAGISRTTPKYKEILISLRLDIRGYKEDLFKNNELTYSLLGDKTGKVTLDSFLKEKPVKDFSSDLKEAFIHVLSSIHPSWINKKIINKNHLGKLMVILTGGGAKLPMVKSLAKGSITIGDNNIPLHLLDVVPGWLSKAYDGEIIELYPQMAVAIGGGKNFILSNLELAEEFV